MPKVKFTHEAAKAPTKAGPSEEGYDVTCVSVEDRGPYIIVHSGVSIQPPEGYYFELVPRSSIYKKGLIQHNSVGIIDATYRGEIMGIFYKTASYNESGTLIGERLMQLIPRRCACLGDFKVVDSLDATDRGDKGFGSTGK